MLDAFLDRYCRLLCALMAACLAAMVVMVFGNVVMRYAFNTGITVSEEMSRWLFVWVIFMGAIVAVRERTHMGVDLLVTMLPPLGQRLCLLLGYGLMLYVTWLMFQGSLAQTRINWATQAPVTGLPLGWMYVSGVVFAVSSGLILLIDFFRIATGRLKPVQIHAPQGLEPDAAELDALEKKH